VLKKFFLSALVFFICAVFLVSCAKSSDFKYDILIDNKISPTTPLSITTNFTFSKVNITIDGTKLSLDSSQLPYVFDDCGDGIYDIGMEFYGISNNLLTKYSTNIIYDSTSPKIDKIGWSIVSGILHIDMKTTDSDFSHMTVTDLVSGDEFYSDTGKQDILLRKNTGVIEFLVSVYDAAGNKSTQSIMIDTQIDNKPVLNSKILKMNTFGDIFVDVTDDWDVDPVIFIKKGDNYVYPNQVLCDPSVSSAECIFIDSSNNYITALMQIKKDLTFPSKIESSPRWISNDLKYLTWRLDDDAAGYVIEGFDPVCGWKLYKETGISYAEVSAQDVMFIRKVSANGTKGLPSPPIYRFSDFILPFSTGVLEDVKQNTMLSQINSPFILSKDIVIEKGKTLFIESGTNIRFFNNSRMIVRGTVFLMHGAARSRFFGDGEIFADGGNIILSNADIENIKITSKSAKFIFLEDLSSDESVEAELTNSLRTCIYNVRADYINFTVKNSSGLFIDNSSLGSVKISNCNEALFSSSSVKNLGFDINSRACFSKMNVSSLSNLNFSYIYMYDSDIGSLINSSFSMVTSNSSRISQIKENSGVIKSE